MRGRTRFLLVLTAVAGFVGANGAHAASPCPATACITVSGRAIGPTGEAIPNYVVGLQSSGHNANVTTNSSGVYEAVVPAPNPNACYQVVGRSDAYYAQAGGSQKFCTTTSVDLRPKIRINGVAGPQKVYLPDASRPAEVPIQVSALSRTFPAPFHGQGLPWELGYDDPNGVVHVDEQHGVFGEPDVRQIASGVWQYLWSATMTMPANEPGFYDMDWGRGGSVFDPMMECQMAWFGYGIDSPPQRSFPGGTVTLDGRRFGDAPGSLVLKGQGAVTTITGAGIVSWSEERIVFTVPPLAKTGWVSVVPPSAVASNAQHLSIDLVSIPLG